MKQLFIVAAIALFASCSNHIIPSTTPIVNTEIKNENNQTILVGKGSIQVLQTQPYKEWYDKNFNAYTIDTATINQLQKINSNITMEIFLGTWCGDSKREVPRMLKVLQAANFDTSKVHLIFVDNSTPTYKQSPQHEERNKFIHHVPTFIVYENNKELNRIVESPTVSLEKDLQLIVNNKKYTPNYTALLQWQKQKGVNTKMSEEALQQLATELKPICKHTGEFNALGYVRMAQKKYNQALNIFKLNTYLYPTSAGTFDSLAEAYYTIGNKELAKTNYEKVLAINPKDENAKKMLEKLK